MMIGDLVTGRSADNTGSGGGGVSVPLQEMDDSGKVQTTHTLGEGRPHPLRRGVVSVVYCVIVYVCVHMTVGNDSCKH